MHLEILVEDQSGKILLESVMEGILGPLGAPHTWRVVAYKGIGKIPPGLSPKSDARARILLDQLPRLLCGYGRSLTRESAAVVVVVDCDKRNCMEMKAELVEVLEKCDPKPTALFRIAVEEMEAWLLGDPIALGQAYPKLKRQVLERYVQDSLCGTWELLADAVLPGGHKKLKEQGYPYIGMQKCEWAKQLGPRMDVARNQSASFQQFRDGLRRLAGVGAKDIITGGDDVKQKGGE